MICPKCGSDIPSAFHFCGMCGEPLPAAEIPAIGPSEPPVDDFEPVPVGPVATQRVGYASTGKEPAPEPSPAPLAERESHATGISGPSFLGLSERGADSAGDSYNYLLEEEPPRRHAGAFVLIAVLVVLGAIAWLKRDTIQHYVANLRKPPAPAASVTADKPAAGSSSDVKSPEQAGVPSQQQAAANPPANSEEPQIIVEDDKTAATGKNNTAALPQRAAEVPPPDTTAPNPPSPGAVNKPVPSSAPTAQDTEPASTPKPARVRATEKEEPGARTLALGEKYLYGHGVAKSCSQALVYLKAAANAGNAEARSHLGALYSTGQCVARDRVEAYHWFALANRAKPANPWLESNLNMLWRDMSPDERRRVGSER